MKPTIDQLIAALGAEDRAARLEAIFQLGGALAGKSPADPDVARASAALEAVIADRSKGSSWVRKRAKRALRKIRGEEPSGPEGEGEEAEAG